MPTRLSPEAVQRAKDEADQWETFKDSAAFTSAGIVPTITALTSVPVGVICGAASAAMIMLGSTKARLARRKAEDPPDPYYWVPVRARRAHFNADAFGGSPLERATVDASYALLYAIAYEGATLRAEERAATARQAQKPKDEQDRLTEGRKYAYRAAEANHDVQRTTDRLAQEFEALDVGRSASSEPGQIPPRLDLALPDQTLVILFRAGFRIEDLRIPIRPRSLPEDPVGSIAADLRKAGAASGSFGRALAESIEASFG